MRVPPYLAFEGLAFVGLLPNHAPIRTGIHGIAWDYMGVNGTGRVWKACNWDWPV
jgi:hypothetical protein